MVVCHARVGYLVLFLVTTRGMHVARRYSKTWHTSLLAICLFNWGDDQGSLMDCNVLQAYYFSLHSWEKYILSYFLIQALLCENFGSTVIHQSALTYSKNNCRKCFLLVQMWNSTPSWWWLVVGGLLVRNVNFLWAILVLNQMRGGHYPCSFTLLLSSLIKVDNKHRSNTSLFLIQYFKRSSVLLLASIDYSASSSSA